MKIWLTVSLFGLMIVGIWVATSRSEPPKVNDVHNFMQLKLEHSKKVLEGLTVEDLNLVAKNAEAMSLLSEDATWQVLQTPEYFQRSAEFRRTADRLTEAARKKNLDGAALAYVELTMQCIDCHKYVRSEHPALPKPSKDK